MRLLVTTDTSRRVDHRQVKLYSQLDKPMVGYVTQVSVPYVLQ
jgi:hypothetical protein